MQSLQNLKVIIVGAGEVGVNVARRLSEHSEIEIVLIESSEVRSALIRDHVNCRHVKGSGLEVETLLRAGLLSCDLFYAVTDADEVNLMACQLAEEIVRRAVAKQGLNQDDELDEEHTQRETQPSEGQPKTSIQALSESGRLSLFARVRSEALIDHLHHLFTSVNVILPERTCNRKVDELLHYHQLFDVIELESNQLKLYGIKVDPSAEAVGKSLLELTQGQEITIAAIARRKRDVRRGRELIIPRAEDRIGADDELYIATTPKHFSEHYHLFSPSEHDGIDQQPLVIAGESVIAHRIFQRLARKRSRGDHDDRGDEHEQARHRSIAMILNSSEQAEIIESADPHGGATIVTGSITDLEHLRKLGVGPHATLLISSTDEENLVCALLAKELGCRRILIINNREQYANLIGQLGFDGIFSPRQLAANEIVHQTLRLMAKSAYNVSSGDDLEVRSFVVSESSPFLDVKLRDLSSLGFPREHAIIAALRQRDSKSHEVPTGESVLSEGATLYIVAPSGDFHRINHLFGKRKSWFRFW